MSSRSKALLFALIAPLASATDFDDCKAIEDAPERLACFDKLTPAEFEESEDEEVSYPLTSRLLSPFKTLERGTLFVLENEQIWRAVEQKTGYYPSVPEKPKVSIEKTFFKAYWLTIEGVNAKIRVKRIK